MPHKSFLLILPALLAVISLWSQSPRQEDSEFILETGGQEFRVDSAFGAKVSSLTIDNWEFMVTPDLVSSDYLWGATLWPSPQSEWNWNNSDKLVWDHSPYAAHIHGDTISFEGREVSVDNGDSFYFRKSFWANPADTTFSLHYEMVNTRNKPIKKALWELTRVPVGGLTFWPTGPGGTWGQLAPATEVIDAHTWYLRESEDGTNLKFFSDGLEGWFAHVDDYGRLFVKTFEDVKKSDFADGEGEIELWVADEYIELENQGICKGIPIGDTLVYEVKWYLRYLPENLEVYPGNMELVEHVRKLISEAVDPPTQLGEKKDDPDLHIYPNPAGDMIRMTLPEQLRRPVIYSLMDVRGKMVLQGEMHHGQIDISEVHRGLYVLLITGPDGILTGKVQVD
jgi:hypothetical protein